MKYLSAVTFLEIATSITARHTAGMVMHSTFCESANPYAFARSNLSDLVRG